MIDDVEEGSAGILNELPITKRASLILTDRQSSQESSYDDESANGPFDIEEEKELKIEVEKVTLTMNRAQTLDPTTHNNIALEEEEKKVDHVEEEEVKSL